MKEIKMLIVDVDGVLTDGKIVLDSRGEEYKSFHVRDGEGIGIARRAGIVIVFLSGRKAKAVEKRAKELGVEEVYQGIKDKVAVYESLKKKYGLKDEEVAYIGDDLNDIPLARRAGFSIAVNNAARELKEAAKYITKRKGGDGAVREAVELILKRSGKWKKVLGEMGIASKQKIVAVIPARYGSTRLEGKPLIEMAGRPMVQHVYERVKKAKVISDVIVATDDRRIYECVLKFGGKAEMTSANHRTGSDRVAEVAGRIDCDVIVNVQCDEPMIEPEMLEELVSPFRDGSVVMATLKHRISSLEELRDPNVVKVVTDGEGNAIYFSRSPIPHTDGYKNVFKHIGIYAYRRDFLLKFVTMERSPLEKLESLEQLRALENGYKIRVVESSYDTIGVDAPGDVEKVKAVMEGK